MRPAVVASSRTSVAVPKRLRVRITTISFCCLCRAIVSRQTTSQQHQPNLAAGDLRAAPVVQVVVEGSIADAEFELGQEALVLHEVQGVEHIHVHVLGRDEHVVHQAFQLDRRGNVVERIRRMECLVLGVANDAGRQVVEAAHIRDGVGLGVLHHERIHDAFARQQPMAGLLLVPLNPQVEPAQTPVSCCGLQGVRPGASGGVGM